MDDKGNRFYFHCRSKALSSHYRDWFWGPPSQRPWESHSLG